MKIEHFNKFIEESQEGGKVAVSDLVTFLRKHLQPQPKYFEEYIPEVLMDEEFISKWEEWINYRRERKPAIKETTAKYQLKLLARSPETAVETINKSIEGGYMGLFPPQIKTNNKWEKIMKD